MKPDAPYLVPDHALADHLALFLKDYVETEPHALRPTSRHFRKFNAKIKAEHRALICLDRFYDTTQLKWLEDLVHDTQTVCLQNNLCLTRVCSIKPIPGLQWTCGLLLEFGLGPLFII